MAIVYHVVKEGIYSVTCLESDIKPINPPDNCSLTVIDTGKIYKSSGGTWIPVVPLIMSNNRWVDSNGSNILGLGDGTIINPYKTIQKAINSITGASTSNPYVINIGLGIFVENIILKDGISLVGLNKHVLDSDMDLTVISGNVTGHYYSQTNCGFTSISFKGSGNTISFLGYNSGNTCTAHFYNCKINSILSATNYSNVILNDIYLDHPTTNPTFLNNSILTFAKGITPRGINIDASSTFMTFGDAYFDKNISGISGETINTSNVNNLFYDNTSSGLSARNPQDAIDELATMINLSGTEKSHSSIHNIDNYSANITYTGFGTTGATSIMKVISSISGNTYETLWAGGNKVQNKLWNNRYVYSYSAIT